MGLTLRAYSDGIRDQIIAAVRRTAEGIAVGYGLPQDRMPVVSVSKTEIAPVLFNDPALADRLRAIAVRTLGAEHVEDSKSLMGSEDVGLFRMENKIPGVMFYLGAVDPPKLAHARETGVPLPGPHSPLFAPVYTPTIKTGVIAMTSMALDLLK